MESHVTWLSTLSMVSAFLLLFATGPTADAIDPDSWDLVAVEFSGSIRFLKNGTIVRSSTVRHYGHAFAYSSANRTLYISGFERGREWISAYNLDEKDLIPRVIPICEHRELYVGEMDFDPVTNTLIWNDRRTKALSKMNVASDGSCSEVETVLDFRGMEDVVVTLDTCNRFVYWAYWTEESITTGKVERVRLDGTDRKEIVSYGGSRQINALAIDNYAGKLYFTSNHAILESNLDGTDRRVFVTNGPDHLPFRLAVDETAVYWTDLWFNTIWKVHKNGTGKRVVASSTGKPVVASWTGMIPELIYTPGNADCERRAESDGSSTLPGVDPMLILLPQALAIVRFLYRQTRIGWW